MNAAEWRATVGLTSVSILRMLGMFMILPVFALYASELPHPATAIETGVAIALFGIIQALLQIPFGIASDHFGRKLTIIVGLFLLAIGSIVAGLARDIHWIMVGRAIQGAGAVAAVVAAWLADATRDEVRTQAMAVHGGGVGLAFVLALVLGPVLSGVIGVNGIFLATGALALLSMVPMLLQPEQPRTPRAAATRPARIFSLLVSKDLLPLNAGSFLLNAMMTAMFAAAPFAIRETLGLEQGQHWQFYLPVVLGALVLTLPLLKLAQRSDGWRRGLFRSAVAAPGLALAIVALDYRSPIVLSAALVIFFLGFAFLQAIMPAVVSRITGAEQRGAAMGGFNTAQVLGAALGNLLGGWARGHWGVAAAFLAAATLSLIWLLFVRATPLPARQISA